jgi:hypothetical protein
MFYAHEPLQKLAQVFCYRFFPISNLHASPGRFTHEIFDIGAKPMTKLLIFVFSALLIPLSPVAWAQETAARDRGSASLPSTCTPGVANTPADTMVIDNLYYVCTATNKWTAVHGLDVDNSWNGNNRFCGPIPWADVSCFGARAAPGGGPRATVRCVKDRPQIVVASASAFRLNDGVTIYGCGATNKMGAPTGLTVAPSEPWGLADTRSAVVGPAGNSEYEYAVVARDIYGALTAAATPVTLKTGQATLGPVHLEISTLSRANDRVTVVTKEPNKLVVGALVDIIPTNSQQFGGWYNVAKIDSSTQFELWNTATDTRAQGWMPGDTTSYSGGGTATYYQENYLKWTVLPGAWEYYVCAKRPGDTALKLIGVTKPTGPQNHYNDAAFEDYGSPYMDGQVFPSYVTNAVCTGSVTNDPLSTWITGISADGLTYTLHDAPTQTATATMVFDDAPGILRALNSTAYFHSERSGPNAYIGGSILIPPAAQPYVINSYLPVPQDVTIWQSGRLILNETVSLAGGDNWFGDWASDGAPQFSWYSGAAVVTNAASPGVYLTGSGNSLRGLTFGDLNANGGTLLVADNASPSNFDYVNFETGAGGAATDYTGMAVILRDTTSTIANYHFTKVVVATGPDQINDKSWSPSFWVAPAQAYGVNGIALTMDRTFFNRRGIAWGGGHGGDASFGGVSGFVSNWSYRQGGIIPYFTCMFCTPYSELTFNDSSQDTEGQPLEAALFNNPTGFLGPHVVAHNATGGAQSPLFQGARPSLAEIDGYFARASAFQNRDVLLKLAGSTLFVNAPYATTGDYSRAPGSVYTVGTPMHGVGGYSWWFDLAAPTAVSVAAAAGGKVPVGTWLYAVTAVGADNGETILSAPSAAVTTSSGTQTVRLKWSPSVGAYSYNVWRCNTAKTCTAPDGTTAGGFPWFRVALHVTGTSYSDASETSGDFAPPMLTGTGSTIINSTGAYAPFFEAPPITVSQLPPAAAGNAGQMRRVTDSTKITAEGQACEGGGSGAALAFSSGTVWKCF